MSLSGSSVTKIILIFLLFKFTSPIMFWSFPNVVGQTSGQLVKPKKRRLGWPSKFKLDALPPLWVVKLVFFKSFIRFNLEFCST